jgi:hypothetical protein
MVAQAELILATVVLVVVVEQALWALVHLGKAVERVAMVSHRILRVLS